MTVSHPPLAELGGYRLREKLGSGGSGTVYRAIDADGRDVAFKLLHPAHAADPAERKRLMREVAALQRIRDPHICRVLDAEIDSAEAFLVTELVEGASLGDSVRASGPFNSGDLTLLATSLARALGVVHAAGLVHRDLKPANVMLGRKGPVLIDFGIADDGAGDHLTHVGMVVGTPGYLAPELLAGGEPTAVTDWWSWAAVLCFAGTGRHPFGAGKVEAILARVRAGQADTQGLPEPSARVLAEALSPDPRRRPAPSEVLDELMADADQIAWNDEEPTEVVGADWIATPTRVLQVEPPAEHETDAWNLAAGKGPTKVLTPEPPAIPAAAPADPEFDDVAALLAARPPRPGSTRVLPPDEVPTDLHRPGPAAPPLRPIAARPPAPSRPLAPPPQAVQSPFPSGADPYLDQGPLASGATPAPVQHGSGRAAGLGALFVVMLAGASLAPWISILAASALLVFGRAVGRAQSALALKRARKGQRRGDAAASALALPWHLLLAVVTQLPGAVIGLVVGMGLTWLVGRQAAAAFGYSPLWLPAGLVLGAAAYVLVSWFGPMSRELRSGTRAVARAVVPRGGATRIVWLVALLAVAAACVVWLAGSPNVAYWPFATFSHSILGD